MKLDSAHSTCAYHETVFTGPSVVFKQTDIFADNATLAVPAVTCHVGPHSQNMLFVEASAKTSAGVSDIFESVAAKLAGGLPVSVGARAAA